MNKLLFTTGSKKLVPPTVSFIPTPMAAGSSVAPNITNSVDGLVGGQLAEKKKKKEKKKTVLRVAGSSVWEDQSLLEWDPSMLFLLIFLNEHSRPCASFKLPPMLFLRRKVGVTDNVVF